MFVELYPILSHNDLQDNKSFELSPQLKENLNRYVDIIKARLIKDNLDNTSNSLRSYLFELRLDILRAIDANSNKSLTQTLSSKEDKGLNIVKEINEELEDFVTEKKSFTHLPINQHLVALLESYKSIWELITKNLIREPKSIIPINISQLKISYETLKYIETIFPSFHYIRKMIDASLDFEFGLFVMELLADNELITNKGQIEQAVVPFAKNALSEYGTYALLSNLWSPTNAQLDQAFFNKMKIKASIINAESGNTVAFSMNQLKQLAAS